MMPADVTSNSTNILNCALAAWTAAVRNGGEPDRDQFLRNYPEIESELRQFFADFDSFKRKETAPPTDPTSSTVQELETQRSVITRGKTHSVTASARYSELSLFKKGGLGELYRASDESFRRNTVVKFLQDRLLDDPDSVTQFRVEAEITGRLDHPGVVPVYSMGEDWDGRPFYVMPLVKGVELSQVIREYHAARIANPHAAETRRLLFSLLENLVRACNTIAYAHDVGIVHCDIKPANIMVGKYGETIVLDWGLAITYERSKTFSTANESVLKPHSAQELSASSQRGGTYGYISPEQLSFDEPITPASDIYSLGATLYEILTGRPPFDHSDRDVVRHIRHGQFKPPRAVVGTVPHRIESICLKAMNLTPQDRYATAKELARDLDHWMSDDELLAVPDKWFHRSARFMRRHWAATSSVVIATMVISALTGWMIHQKEKNRYVLQQNELIHNSLNSSLDTFEDICQPFAFGELNNLSVFRRFADKINDFATFYLEQFGGNPLMLDHTGRVYELRATSSRSSETKKALNDYAKAEEIYEQRLLQTKNPSLAEELERQLVHVRLSQGALHLQLYDLPKAENVLLESREVLERFQKRGNKNVELEHERAEIYHLLGQLNLARYSSGSTRERELQESERFLKTSTEIRTSLIGQAKTENRRNRNRDLARSHGYLGDLYSAQGRIGEAEKSYLISKNLREELLRSNRTDPEFRFQFARGQGNFGLLEWNYKGNLEQGLENLIDVTRMQQDLTKEFPEVVSFGNDLAYYQLVLAEVALILGERNPTNQPRYFPLGRDCAENSAKFHGDKLRTSGNDQESQHGLAWSLVTLATLDLLDGKQDESVSRAQAAKKQLLSRDGGEFTLRGDQLVTLAIANSLSGNVEAAQKALNDSVNRGMNVSMRFRNLGRTGLKALAVDPIFGPQFEALCKRMESGLTLH